MSSRGTGIPQDNVIFGMVLFAFIIFITLKGELKTYLAFFTPGSTLGPQAVPVTGQAVPVTGQPLAAGANTANTTINGAPTPTANTLWNFLTGNWYYDSNENNSPVTTPLGSGGIGGA